jgi:yecA family protein
MADFDRLQNSLQILGSMTDAAESHGTLCGLLLGNQEFERWLSYTLENEVDQRDLQARAEMEIMRTIYADAKTQMNADDMSFELMLPDEDQEFAQRLLGLAGWCRGFLYGLAANGEGMVERLSEQGRECMDDLLQISQLDHDEEQNDETEVVYEELAEHVRLSVIFMNDELNPLSASSNQVH